MKAVIKGLSIMLIYHCWNQGRTNTDIQQKCNQLIARPTLNKQTGQYNRKLSSVKSLWQIRYGALFKHLSLFVKIIIKEEQSFSSALFSRDVSAQPCPVYINYSDSSFFSVHLSIYATGFIRKQSLASPSLFTNGTCKKNIYQVLYMVQVFNPVPAYILINNYYTSV